MIKISSNYFGAALAFLVGAAIAFINYAISKRILKKQTAHFASATVFRQLLQIGYLVLLLVFGSYTPWNKTYLLIGGVLGITVPMFWFTHRLVQVSVSLQKDANRKEESSNG
ncbi:MAG: hypothetical protein IJ333_09465 [Clostridia bacterium]|nr:hypothetical protein [Clostridia bacterium]